MPGKDVLQRRDALVDRGEFDIVMDALRIRLEGQDRGADVVEVGAFVA